MGHTQKSCFNFKCYVAEYRCLCYLLSQSRGVGTGFFRTTAWVHSAVRVSDVCACLNFLRAAGVYAERFTAGPKLKACGFCLVFVTSCFCRTYLYIYISRSCASYCQHFHSMTAAQAEERFELPSGSLYLCVWPGRTDMIR